MLLRQQTGVVEDSRSGCPSGDVDGHQQGLGIRGDPFSDFDGLP
jgi:hypothetical protein